MEIEFKPISPIKYIQYMAKQLSADRVYPSRLNDLMTTKRSVAISRRKKKLKKSRN